MCNQLANHHGKIRRYRHEIENVHAAENSPRLLRDLEQLNAGLELIGEPRWRRRELVIKAGLDCLPPIRRRALAHVAGQPESCRTDKIAEALSMPDSTVRRALEDLECHRVLRYEKNGVAHKWSLTEDFKRRWSVLFPA